MTILYNVPGLGQVRPGTPFSLPTVIGKDEEGNDILDVVSYPSNWLELATVEDLAARGISKTEETEPEPQPPTKAELIAYADAKLEAVQAGGCVINGVPVATTIKGLTFLNGAVSRAKENPAAMTHWVVDETLTVELTAEQTKAIGLAVGDWVQSTYNALASVYAAISSEEITAFAEIDAFAWPSNT